MSRPLKRKPLGVPWSKRSEPKVPKWNLIAPELRNAVYDRERGLCASCGDPIQRHHFECHHRLLRSRGGMDSIANLVALCSGNGGCHTRLHNRPTIATEAGFMVPSGHDPALWPLNLHFSGRFVLLTLSGDYREAT